VDGASGQLEKRVTSGTDKSARNAGTSFGVAARNVSRLVDNTGNLRLAIGGMVSSTVDFFADVPDDWCQLALSPPISGKNKSFHDAGSCLMEPPIATAITALAIHADLIGASRAVFIFC